MKFQTEDFKRVSVKPEDVQAVRFMDGDVLVVYTAGDCDVFLPYVQL